MLKTSREEKGKSSCLHLETLIGNGERKLGGNYYCWSKWKVSFHLTHAMALDTNSFQPIMSSDIPDRINELFFGVRNPDWACFLVSIFFAENGAGVNKMTNITNELRLLSLLSRFRCFFPQGDPSH